MKILKVSVVVLVVLLAVFVVVAPVGPVPGFFIGGERADVPESWGDTSSVHEILLKVDGGALPRVVTIWMVQADGALYVLGSAESGWTSALGPGGPVQMRMNGKTYALNATRVTAGWEPIVTAYLDKYRPHYPEIVGGIEAGEDAAGGVAVFRLTGA